MIITRSHPCNWTNQ